ncbi:transglutaminase-like domain-containing protein [Cellulomonas sp. McL0617]|uniref:transglutaminase-like domain-containing protein n=1 Tax=Cellulomonas sp. McL0617 TaxID=3415675 RepID=UPI003CE8E249
MTTPARRPRPLRAGAIDAVVLLSMLGVALLPLLSVYGDQSGVPALAGGLVLGAGVAAVGAWRRWSALTVVAVLLVVFFVAGGPLAAPRTTKGGVVPTLDTGTALARGVASTWKQVLTLQPPIGTSGTLLVAMYALAFVGAAVAVAVTLRARRPAVGASAAVVPIVAVVGAIVLGTRNPSVSPTLTGTVLAVVLLPWAAWRSGGLRVQRVVSTAMLLVVAAAAGTFGAPAVVASSERFVVRDQIVPPFDPRDYPSPLSAFREFVKQDADTPLFTVSGLPAGARVRLATMDRYDGVVWNVAGDGSAEASGEFRRVGDVIETSARGKPATVKFTIDDLGGVWLPTVGQATSFDVGDSTAAGGLRYNDATGAAVVTGGIHHGLSYDVDAVVPPVIDAATTVGRAPASDVAQPALSSVPDLVSVTAADVARDAGSPVQIATALSDWLSKQGFFSHGIVDAGDYASLSGHGADRITSLLGGDVMVGDGEQYAAALALMARSMGLPARVVLGFVPGSAAAGEKAADGSVTVTGKDIQAWVEIPFQGYGWIPFDPTPPPEQTPQENNKDKQTEPNPQVVQPPPPPPAAVNAPDEDTEQPQTDDPAPDTSSVPLWLRVTQVAGVAAIPLAVLAAPFVVIVVLKVRRRRRRRRSADLVARVAGGWDEVLDVARDLRHPTGGLATRNESARAIAASFEDVADGAVVASRVGALARSADRAVFSPATPSPEQAAAYWADVQVAVEAMTHSVGWRRRFRARLSTASLRQEKRRRRAARRSVVSS